MEGSRKRPLDQNVRIEDSPYYKMRAIVRDLRPSVIEVLKAPEFKNSKAAEEICEKMKIVMDLYKKMMSDPPTRQLDLWVTGGSAFGWNYITYLDTKITYYGRTKESFRADNLKKKSQVE